jgi:hypothetical protein
MLEFWAPMSALGQKQTRGNQIAMSALPPKADIPQHRLDVRYVPKADIRFWSEMKGTANEGGPLFLKASDDVECLVSAEACRRELQSCEFPAL